MVTRNKLALGAVLLLAGIVALAWALAARTEPQDKQPIGLMTSLPIFWGEGVAFENALADDQHRHWVREHLERQHELVPLDTLATPDGAEPSTAMQQLGTLILAQPRALAPADFAALDAWLRAGGKALIFADPLLTEHFDFGFGDPRRPEGAALMSPIFTRWGLRQTFDESQPEGAHSLPFGDIAIPVHQYGRFQFLGSGEAACQLLVDGLIADCAVGDGRAFVVGDAALLDGHSEFAGQSIAFDAILKRAALSDD